MASLASPSLSTLRFSTDLTSAALVSFPVRVAIPAGQRKVGMRVMAVAKFKGTQMREKRLTEMIEKKVLEAKEVCGEGDPITDECKVAWDEVEEVSQAKADLRLKLKDSDPLESFCQDNPETDECRIYED
ncbi:PREDICTED: calvin cycle protein CP12-3, chloroplastic [Fragaria vesca subsp. vesca]|uniref:calvin cycle protein CP12-3, chloroplastic n=1 Tax=Fragaria vesca subsp. vesca TaxID=101020 RepID=UPI0002C34D29|nr:PREDICTED: calvin cycle protein CP12-3, chloroplastic [Fragaria vesca subsp. vesca]